MNWMTDFQNVLTAVVGVVVALDTFWTRHARNIVQDLRNGELEKKVKDAVQKAMEEYRRDHGQF